MKNTLKNRGGFALPTVLIASVIMLAVLVASISAVAATRTALQSQFFAQLARTAAESGLAMAESCIKSGTATWSNPLRPGGDCTGLASPCATSNCYLSSGDGVRATFEVSAPTVAGDASTVEATGSIEQLRASTGTVVRTYQQKLRQKDVTTGTPEVTWRQLTAADNQTCGIAVDNKAYCWGSNGVGRLGDGTTTNRTTPVAVAQGAMPAGATIRQLTTGGSQTCAIASDNNAYCWGNNSTGQLGDGTTTNRTTPVAVAQGAMPAGATIRQIVLASNHACALASDNKAYCWGYNANGQLGDGTTTQRTTPVAVAQGAMPAGATIRQLSAVSGHTCAIASDNKAYCWGYNAYGGLGDGTTTQRTTPVAVAQGAMPAGATIRQVSAGSSYSCAIASDNKAYCWGLNSSSQLGDGTTTTPRTTPVAVAQGAMPTGATIQQIVTSFTHTCAVASDNEAYCWGSNSGNQLGDGTTTTRNSPIAVAQGAMPSDATVRQLATGNTHSCAIASNNKIYCWGGNSEGRLGDGTTTTRPTAVMVANGVVPTPGGLTSNSLGIGVTHACAIASDNKAYCWGNNVYGMLGNGKTTAWNINNPPVAVAQGAMPTGATMRQLAVGSTHTCAIASDNKAYCWGNNGFLLGTGTTANSSVPVAVAQGAIPTGATIRQLAVGQYHTCVLASDNKAYCWGNNSDGRLGDGTTTNSNVPVAVAQGAIPTGVTIRQLSIAVGVHTCALASDNKVYCWGTNSSAQLGDGTTTARSTPVAVAQGAIPTGATIRQLAVGQYHTCVLASDNKAYCWGNNSDGRLGDGTTTQRTTPVAVAQGTIPTGATIRQLSTEGAAHSCAIASDNKAYCWGYNSSGQLGDGTTTQRTTPVAVAQGTIPTGATIRQLIAAVYQTCAIASDNKAYCWGNNADGQLGDGTTTSRSTPTGPLVFPTPAPPVTTTYYY